MHLIRGKLVKEGLGVRTGGSWERRILEEMLIHEIAREGKRRKLGEKNSI